MTHTTKHTPGPWIVRNFAVNGETRSEVLDANGGNACVQVNAHLIAAAPAMYAETRAAFELLIDLRDLSVMPSAYQAIIQKRITALQTVLAQAEGKAL